MAGRGWWWWSRTATAVVVRWSGRAGSGSRSRSRSLRARRRLERASGAGPALAELHRGGRLAGVDSAGAGQAQAAHGASAISRLQGCWRATARFMGREGGQQVMSRYCIQTLQRKAVVHTVRAHAQTRTLGATLLPRLLPMLLLLLAPLRLSPSPLSSLPYSTGHLYWPASTKAECRRARTRVVNSTPHASRTRRPPTPTHAAVSHADRASLVSLPPPQQPARPSPRAVSHGRRGQRTT